MALACSRIRNANALSMRSSRERRPVVHDGLDHFEPLGYILLGPAMLSATSDGPFSILLTNEVGEVDVVLVGIFNVILNGLDDVIEVQMQSMDGTEIVKVLRLDVEGHP